MSRKFFFLIVLLITQLQFFAQPALAANSCKDNQIDWDPKIFSEGQIQYLLNFTIQNANTLATLKTKPYVRLLADYFEFGVRSGGTYTNPPVKIDGTKFSLVLTGNLATGNTHHGVLQWSPTATGDYEDFCSDVNYQIGIVRRCTIMDQSIPNKIPPPPNSSLTVKFVGKPNTDYQFRIGDAIVSSIKTDNSGQGEFPAVVVPGSNGDTKRLTVISFAAGTESCFKDTKIDSTAPIPAPIPAGPVQPAPAAAVVKQCPKEGEQFNPAIHLDPKTCTSGGGDSCDTKDNRGPAMKTAIGCIHTNPAELAKDIMTWVIGIGGGLAFLMMLLGAFQMITSAGNPETLNAGRERITSAVIGLLFVIFAVLLLQIIGVDILKIPGFGR